MDLYLLAELKTISLKITTVDMKRPPADFRTNFEAAQPPILIDTGVAILENEKIERHIMKHVPGGHNLFVADNEVAKRIENLYNRFKVTIDIWWKNVYNQWFCKLYPVMEWKSNNILFLKVMLVKKDESSKKSVINILKVCNFFLYVFLYLFEFY